MYGLHDACLITMVCVTVVTVSGLYITDTCTVSVVKGYYEGDVLLAAFIPVHGRGPDDIYGSGSCGPLQADDGVQFVEGLHFALDAVNRSPKLLPGLTLGAVVFDSCDEETRALEHAVDMVRFRGTPGSQVEVPYTCERGGELVPEPELDLYRKVVAVVGDASSEVSIILASLLRLYEIPQISYLSTSTELNNFIRYPYFKRTVPSDDNTANAMVQVLKAFNWTYIMFLYDDSSYGISGYGEFVKVSATEGVCLALSKKVDLNWGPDNYDLLLTKMCNTPNANVVILYMDHHQAQHVFEAAVRKGVKRRFTWLGGDAWSGRGLEVIGLETVIENAITIQPFAYRHEEFDSYIHNLTLTNETKLRNPWLVDMLESTFNCTMQGISKRSQTDIMCSGNESLSEAGYRQHSSLHYIMDSVRALAEALHVYYHELDVTDTADTCGVMPYSNISGEVLNKILKSVKFKATAGYNFSFQHGGNGPPHYTIMNFHKKGGRYQWSSIGYYTADQRSNYLQFTDDFLGRMDEYPHSSCSEECVSGQIKEIVSGNECCWICVNCTEYQIAYINHSTEDQLCINCPLGTLPSEDSTACAEIEESYVNPKTPWSIASMVMAVAGLILAVFATVGFIKFYQTPVIKACGREQSLLLLVGIYMSYLSCFLLVNKPTPVTCGAQRLAVGLCFTVIYATILTKTNRISRIFNAAKGPNPSIVPKYIGPTSQVVISLLITSMEVVILVTWMIIVPPGTTHVYPTRDQNVLVCTGSEDVTCIIPLVYPFLLMLACIIFAFRTRKTPDGFNESRFIAFSSYTTSVVWLAFLPLYFASNDERLRAFILCMSLCINATVVLVCIMGHKLYICTFRPKKNTKEAVMARTSSLASGIYVLETERNIGRTPTIDSSST